MRRIESARANESRTCLGRNLVESISLELSRTMDFLAAESGGDLSSGWEAPRRFVVTLSKINGCSGSSDAMIAVPCISRAAGDVDPDNRTTAVNDTAIAPRTTPRVLKNLFSLTNMDKEIGFTTEIENSQSCKPHGHRQRGYVCDARLLIK